MTNLECVVATLEAHREARQWADHAVALAVLARLGLSAEDEVGVPAPVPVTIITPIEPPPFIAPPPDAAEAPATP